MVLSEGLEVEGLGFRVQGVEFHILEGFRAATRAYGGFTKFRVCSLGPKENGSSVITKGLRGPFFSVHGMAHLVSPKLQTHHRRCDRVRGTSAAGCSSGTSWRSLNRISSFVA